MRFRKNNKGMTLIELIISMAISAIILSMIIMIISSASKSFRRTNDEVNLQLEAQTTINQLSNLAMEASKIEKSLNIPPPIEDKYIITSLPKSYAILFIKDVQRLYLIDEDTPSAADAAAYSDTEDFRAKYLMAEYVDEFTISGYGTNKITINITFKLGSDIYKVNKKIKLRNAN